MRNGVIKLGWHKQIPVNLCLIAFEEGGKVGTGRKAVVELKVCVFFLYVPLDTG